MKVCVIKSGDRYFMRFVLNSHSPEVSGDPKNACRLSMSNAKRVKRRMKKAGISSEIIVIGESK